MVQTKPAQTKPAQAETAQETRSSNEAFSGLRTTLFTPSRWRLWHNFPQKLGALTAAIVLWFAATADRRATIARTFEVPLGVTGIDSSHVVSNLPTTVSVTLEGQSSRLENLPVGLIEASVSVADIDEGNFTRGVKLNEPVGTTLLRLEPKQVSGSLDAVVREKVEVRAALLESSAAPPLRVKLNPAEVTAIGPRAKVSQVAYAMALANRQVSSKGFEVQLTPIDSAGKPVEGVRFEPTRAKISQ